MFVKLNLLLIFFSLIFSLQGQTLKWNLKWDANTEGDMYLYRVFRDNAPLPTSKLDSVIHPGTSFEDSQIQKGILYYYRVQAVNLSLNVSPYSDQISAAIPNISGFPQDMSLPADTTIVLNLDSYVADPDHADNLLTWTVSGNSVLQVDINQSNHNATIHTPETWTVVESLVFTCTDPDTFFDVATLNISSPADPQAQAPQFSEIPQQTTPEDQSIELDLIDYVTDDDSTPENLHFQVTAGAHLQTQLSGSVLQIIPNANWFGNSTVNVTVTDQTQLSDAINIAVGVTAVNDAPAILTLPASSIIQDTTIELDVSNWATDIDDDDSNLQWSFNNYYHLVLDYQAQNHILKITAPTDWSGFEYIQATVNDTDGATDMDTLLIRVTEASFPPQINGLPNVSFPEDDSSTVQLSDYVSDQDTPAENLYWRVSGNNHITVIINHSTHQALFKAEKDWNGNEEFYLVVMDPDQGVDSALTTVSVEAVNDAPSLLTLPALNLSEQLQQNINLNNYVLDVDDTYDNLQWSYSGNSNVSVVISTQGSATFTADSGWYGQEEIIISVKDLAGAEDTQSMTIFRQNLQHAPVISGLQGLQMSEDSERNIDLAEYVSDPDHNKNELSWTFSATDHILLNYDEQSMNLQLKPQENWYGSENIALRVEDPDHNFDLDTLTIVVTPVNDAPQLLQIPNINLFGSTVYTIDLKEFIIEPDGFDDLVNIELLGANEGFIGYYLDTQNYQLTFFTPADYRGRETYLLRITDSENEQATAVFTVDVRKDNLENKISMAYFGDQTNVLFSWRTINYTKDYIQFGENQNYGQTSEKDIEYTTQHEILLENLLPNISYHFRIVSIDEQLKTSYSPDSVFSTGLQNSEINVFPIPWKSSGGMNRDGIYFTNLQQGYKVKIFNLAGEPVYSNDDPDIIFEWDVKNNAGRNVSSGLYIYTIRDKNNKRKYSGKIIIIR